MNAPGATIVHVDATHPAPETISRAGEILRRGGLVAIPTETVYGLAGNALEADAVARIFAAKGRPPHNPIIVHVADEDGARRLTTDWPAAAARLAREYWPGPLTLVLPRAAIVPGIVCAGGSTVALRSPAHAVALAVIHAAGVPLAAPSANRSGRLSPTRAEHVSAALGGNVELILDAGPTPGGIESTVVDLTTPLPCILRPGLITAAMLRESLGVDVQIAPQSGAHSLRSPGQLSRHYAPQAPTECRDDARDRVAQLARSGARIGWLALAGTTPIADANVIRRELPREPAGYAAGLYAMLHELDAAGVEIIVIESPPATADWAAIHDRLSRATAGQ